MARAFLGATAFEIHDVDLAHGRIGIGGVDEILWSSKFLECYHRILTEMLGSAEAKNRALYRVGKEGGAYEIDEALRQNRWAPRLLVSLVEESASREVMRADPAMHRFFLLSMRMVSRIIISEGGWGVVDELDVLADPMRVVLLHSNEARWLGPCAQPVCAVCAGVIAGYSSRIFRTDLDAHEVECQATGASRCVFELRPAH